MHLSRHVVHGRSPCRDVKRRDKRERVRDVPVKAGKAAQSSLRPVWKSRHHHLYSAATRCAGPEQPSAAPPRTGEGRRHTPRRQPTAEGCVTGSRSPLRAGDAFSSVSRRQFAQRGVGASARTLSTSSGSGMGAGGVAAADIFRNCQSRAAPTRLRRLPVLRCRRSADLWRQGNPDASSHSASMGLNCNAERRDSGGRQARYGRGPWQVASAQLCGVEAQSGRIVDEHWSAFGRHRDVDGRDPAGREGNQCLGGEVSKRGQSASHPVRKR
jgi:hypothetical protein